jgi:hypothetical protein
VSTSAVDTWRDVKIRTKNLTEVPNKFLPLIQVPPMIQNKTEVLNLKSRKTQVTIGYLTLYFIPHHCIFFKLKEKKKKKKKKRKEEKKTPKVWDELSDVSNSRITA